MSWALTQNIGIVWQIPLSAAVVFHQLAFKINILRGGSHYVGLSVLELCMQSDMVLEKELRVLHLDLQAAGRENEPLGLA